ncbi:MAG: hypothetical protein Q7K35_03535 [bacterium]|nr:hypothetical protein [bacterium]
MPIFLMAWFFVFGGTAQANDIIWDNSQIRIISYFEVNSWDRLIIKPGTIVKMAAGGKIVSYGDIEAIGEADNPIVFTSIKDDSAGGDTNSDGGATTPAMGDWGYFLIQGEGKHVTFDYVEIHYAGGGDSGLGNTGQYMRPVNFISVSNSGGSGVKLKEINITHSKITNNFGGISFSSDAIFKISESNFYNEMNCPLPSSSNWTWRPTQLRCDQLSLSKASGTKIEAPLVYWGHKDGPTTIEDYLQGIKKGAQVYYNANFIPFLIEPWPSDLTGPVEDEINPVIIVPGIMGSYLYSYINPGLEVWPAVARTVIDPWDLHLNELIMDEQGKPLPNTMIVPPQDIVRTILDNDFYEGMINELKQNGYVENENLFVFPYDWRLDLNWSAGGIPYNGFDSLKDKIEKVKLLTGAEKVDIIAHSMGGLVAKNYIKHYGSGSVDKFIDIGTPHLGAPGAFKILMYGDDLDFNYFGLGLNSEKIKFISQNFPSIYQLLPSQNYFDSANSDYTYYIYDMHDLDNNGITDKLNYAQSIDFMKNADRNNYLLGYNDVLHSDLDNYSPKADGIETYNIMGCGSPTIGQIFVLNKEKSGGYEYGLKYISGDGTVPLRSAEALQADDSYYIKGVEHSSLPGANGVKQVTRAILENKISSFSLANYPVMSRDDSNCALTGTQISFHSPIDLNVYDENNHHLGPNESGDIEMGIEGAQYDNLDGNKFVFLPEGHNYQVVGSSTASGSFNARVQTVQAGQYTQTVYYNQVPLNSASTTVKLQINNGQTAGAIEIDQDGDKTFEATAEPSAVLNKAEAADLVKPETQIEISGSGGTVESGGYYISTTTVALIAADNQGGSGILKTEYSLDNGLTWLNYGDPIIFNGDGEYSVLFKSTDRAGNTEEEKAQALKIDMAAPIINILLPLENEEFTRDGSFMPEYEMSDSYSGVTTGSLAVLIDDQPISQLEQDLFYYDLGEHTLKIAVRDMAGNQAEVSVKFTVSADLDSAISDVNRSYDLGWIKNKTARTWLNKELAEIKKYEERFGQRQEKLNERQKSIMSQCLKKKNQTWCEKRLKNYDKVVYKLSLVHKKIIAKRFQEILKKLDDYYKKQWLNSSAYDMIKADINYLIINL